MVGAMLVLVVLVLAYVGVQALSEQPATTVQTVDYQRVVPGARDAADFELVAPRRLPAGWRATTVSFDTAPQAHWHLGVLTDEGRYVGLEQADDPVRAMVREYVDEAARRGSPVDVGGDSWSTYTDAGGDLALVRRAGRTTTLVVGHDVPRSDLMSYTADLR
jgi:hypothetical protein